MTPLRRITSLLALALLLQGCLAKECSEIGCHSGATVFVRSIKRDDVRAIRVCLAGSCRDLPWTRTTVCTDTVGESPSLSACMLEQDGLQLAVNDREVHDGDVLSVRIEGENAVLLDEERTLTYENTYPNGKDCPGHCRIATAEL